MKPSSLTCQLVILSALLTGSVFAQGPSPSTSARVDRIIEKASPSVALVFAGKSAAQLESVGSALVVRETGILLTPYHMIKDAGVVQVRFKNGETFDDVQLLGVDRRRDIAAIRISAQGLPVLPVAATNRTKVGAAIWVVSNAASLPWSASTGIVSSYRMADEIEGAGQGYRLIQITAPASEGAGGGVLLNDQAEALGLLVGTLDSGKNLNFAVPLESVVGLADASPSRTFASASAAEPPVEPRSVSTNTVAPPGEQRPVYPNEAAPVAERRPVYMNDLLVPPAPAPPKADLQAPDLAKSELVKSKDPDFILRNFRTMCVDTAKAQFFGNDQMKAALGNNKDFASLHISLVDDPSLADVVLEVGYTFAWDYPFSLRHQNTTLILVSGKGSGPFSGPAGATSVAKQLAKLLKPYRTGAAPK